MSNDKTQIKLVTPGNVKTIEAPDYGTILLTFHDGKIKAIEESKKTLFK